MADLDRNKSYAQVFNDPEGRHFEQNGQFFGADGKPWVAPDAAPATAKPAKKAAAASQVDAQLQEPT